MTVREAAILSIYTGYKLCQWEDILNVAGELLGRRVDNTFILSSANEERAELIQNVKPLVNEIIYNLTV